MTQTNNNQLKIEIKIIMHYIIKKTMKGLDINMEKDMSVLPSKNYMTCLGEIAIPIEMPKIIVLEMYKLILKL